MIQTKLTTIRLDEKSREFKNISGVSWNYIVKMGIEYLQKQPDLAKKLEELQENNQNLMEKLRILKLETWELSGKLDKKQDILAKKDNFLDKNVIQND